MPSPSPTGTINILAADTATRCCTVALCRAAEGEPSAPVSLGAETLLDGQRLHAERLIAVVDSVLAGAGVTLEEVHLLAVSIGPGSFTGLRIGAAAFQGLALARRLPLVAVPTLDALARLAGPGAGMVVPMLDARMGEVFAAAYRRTGGLPEKITGDLVAPVGEILGKIPADSGPCVFLGDGADRYEEELRAQMPSAVIVPSPGNTPRASLVAAEAWCLYHAGIDTSPASAVPVYLRLSQAEAAREARLGHDAGNG